MTAKELLRHSSVAITAAHYVENRKRGTTGLGGERRPSDASRCGTLALASTKLIDLSGVMDKWDFHPQETYKSLISIAIEALKALALVNGGAAVAILAYLGNVASRASAMRLPNMIWPLACFAGGLFLTLVAFIGAYLTQLQLYQEDLARDFPKSPPIKEHHRIYLWITIPTGLLAAVAFGIGCILAAMIFAQN